MTAGKKAKAKLAAAGTARRKKGVTEKRRRYQKEFSPRLTRFYALIGKNTPATVEQASKLLSQVVARNPNDILAIAEKSFILIHKWRNDVDAASELGECGTAFGVADPRECAIRWAQLAIDTANNQHISSPYGDWAMAYAQKYARSPQVSGYHYQRALNYPNSAFLPSTPAKPRGRKHLIVEWVESQMYWLPRSNLPALVDIIDAHPANGRAEYWVNWIKCFALHLMEDFAGSNDLYNSDHLPGDADVSLIIAANYARLHDNANRVRHRDRFRTKPGNETWDVEKEM